MKYYIIAGEASGDLHAANLLRALKQEDPDAIFRGWGGDKMQAQGAKIVKHYKDLAFMGFLEVAMHLRTIFRNLRFCKKDILQWKPDVVILVDYPGFNLRIAKFLKQKGIRVFYYISPQVWAWKESRVEIIRQTVERMYVILPFEKDFYNKHHYEVDFVGHPLLDALQGRQKDLDFRKRNGLDSRPIIALLPGSRRQEINKMLPELIKVAPLFPDYQFVVAGLSNIGKEFYGKYLSFDYAQDDAGHVEKKLVTLSEVQVRHVQGQSASSFNYAQDDNARGYANNISLVMDETYSILENAYAALVTSGTATMETALFKVPQIVCYKGSWLSYQIGRQLIKVKYIAMVNLVMEMEVVKELIQSNLNRDNLEKELTRILNEDTRKQILNDYDALAGKLGGSGASQRTAKLMVLQLTSSKP